MKQNISFDLDNVVFNFTPMYRRAFTDCVKLFSASTDWDYNKCFPKDVADRFTHLIKTDAIFGMKLLKNEIPSVLKELESKYHIYYITSQLVSNKNKRIEQLKRNGINNGELIITGYSKIDVIKELNPIVHFDDSPVVIDECLDNNVGVHMISNKSTPYNHYLRDKVKWSGNLLYGIQKECR